MIAPSPEKSMGQECDSAAAELLSWDASQSVLDETMEWLMGNAVLREVTSGRELVEAKAREAQLYQVTGNVEQEFEIGDTKHRQDLIETSFSDIAGDRSGRSWCQRCGQAGHHAPDCVDPDAGQPRPPGTGHDFDRFNVTRSADEC